MLLERGVRIAKDTPGNDMSKPLMDGWSMERISRVLGSIESGVSYEFGHTALAQNGMRLFA